MTEKSSVSDKLPSGGFRLFAAYFVSWLVVLYLAKRIYNSWHSKKVAARRSKWFGGHAERDAYEAALTEAASADPTSLSAEKEREAEERLRKLLLRRAMTDFRRILQLNTEKESLYNLMRSGAVSEDMWDEFKEAENEMQVEIFDLQAEAETFKQGWSDGILKDAAELVKREDQLNAIKREKEKQERQRAIDEKKAVKQKEGEERQMREQEERAAKLRERFLATGK